MFSVSLMCLFLVQFSAKFLLCLYTDYLCTCICNFTQLGAVDEHYNYNYRTITEYLDLIVIISCSVLIRNNGPG